MLKKVLILVYAVLLTVPVFGAGMEDACVCRNGKWVRVSRPTAVRPAEEIGGNTKIVDDSKALHIVLALPANYQRCGSCLALSRGFDRDPNLLVARKLAIFHRIHEGDAKFEQGWGKVMPWCNSKRTGVMSTGVCLVQGSGKNAIIVKRWKSPCAGFGGELTSKIREWRKKHLEEILGITPDDTVPPDDVLPPDDTMIPPMDEEPAVPPVEESVVDPLKLGMTVLVVGFVTWLVMFKRGMSG